MSTAPEQSPRGTVEWYFEMGFRCVFWAQIGNAKGPTEDGWPNKVKTIADYHDGNRVGVITGVEVSPGKFLHDVDVDWATGAPIAKKLIPESGFSFGRKSKKFSHAFFLLPEALPSVEYHDIDKTMLIELRGTKQDGTHGKQTMVPPSVWSKEGTREQLVFTYAKLPTFLEDVLRTKQQICLAAIGMLIAKHLGKNGFGHDARLAWAGFLLRAGVAPDDLIAMGEGMSTTCNNVEVGDVANTVKSTVASLAVEGKKVKGGPALAKIIGKDGKAVVALVNEWLGRDSDFIRIEDKIVKDSQENLRRALAKLGYELSFNTFSEKFMVNDVPLEDPELIEIWARIDEECKYKPEWEFYRRITKRFAWNNPYHPVRDYLDGLAWDGVPRIDTWLVEYGGAVDATTQSDADDSPTYLQAVSSILLIAAVRRVREPGCKYDEMVILESPQGLLKSSALRALCPKPEWFSDDFPLNLKAKELIEATLGKWIIESSDLSGKRKTEVEQLKAMMSRQVDGPRRAAYGWLPQERSRHFILVGTTNSTAYLNDPTGARRFWPIEVKQFDVEGIKAVRDQLWAEAAYREAQRESIRLPQRLWPDAEREQEKRREHDPWEHTIETLLDDPTLVTPDSTGRRTVTTSAIWNALGIDVERRDRYGALRISELMQRFKFARTKVWDEELKKTVVGYREIGQSTLGEEG